MGLKLGVLSGLGKEKSSLEVGNQNVENLGKPC